MHWWADLWDNWARTFGYDRWEWGSASDAFAAIGTIGAFAATLLILKRDRRAKGEELARAVTAWYTTDYSVDPNDQDSDNLSVTVRVHNSSAKPITGVRCFAMRRGDWGPGIPVRNPANNLIDADTISQGETMEFYREEHMPIDGLETVVLRFFDGDRVEWRIDLKAGELRRADLKPKMRWLRRLVAGLRRLPAQASESLKKVRIHLRRRDR